MTVHAGQRMDPPVPQGIGLRDDQRRRRSRGACSARGFALQDSPSDARSLRGLNGGSTLQGEAVGGKVVLDVIEPCEHRRAHVGQDEPVGRQLARVLT